MEKKRQCSYCKTWVTGHGIHSCLSSDEYRTKIQQRNKQIKHLKDRVKEQDEQLRLIHMWVHEVISDKDKVGKVIGLTTTR